MHNKLIEKFKKEGLINQDLFQEMIDTSKILKVKKNEVLIGLSSNQKYTYFIASGSFVVYLFSEEGNSKAVWFHFDDLFSMATCADSYFLDEPTKYEIRALEDSTVIRFNKKNFDSWILKYPIFNQFYIHGITHNRVIVQEARAQRLVCTPEKYFIYLSEKFPSMVSRVSSKHMAHFLGVSPEWFSKLKRRMKQV